ncbi:MAG: hypothetical protein LBM92_08670 [Opitutaceae bacterium]|jgi:hypothetical protein|nr:hypothetical protein [Opitutaceae bacterium]
MKHARRLLALFVLAVSAAATGWAASPQLSGEVVGQLDTLRDLVSKRDYPALLKFLETLLPKTGPESFDRALLSQIHAQVLINIEPPRYTDAIKSLETAILLGDAHGYFDTNTTLNALHTLSELYYQAASSTEDAATRRQQQRLAYDRIATWLARAPDPFSRESITAAGIRGASDDDTGEKDAAAARKNENTRDSPEKKQDARNPEIPLRLQIAAAHLYAATLLYADATLDPDKADRNTLLRADGHAKKSLLLRDRADEPTLVLRLAVNQQLRRHAAAAEILEFLAARAPSNSAYWQQLASAYIILADEKTAADAAGEKNLPADGLAPHAARHRWRLRAILAFERAAAAGHRFSPGERHNHIALLAECGHHAAAAALLENSLADGSMPSTRDNWRLLAALLQHNREIDRAAAALRAAIERIPGEAGELSHTLAHLSYSEGRAADAYPHLKRAVLGKLAKPAEAWFLLSYLACELGYFSEAGDVIAGALRQPGARVDDLHRLRDAAASALAAAGEKEPAPGAP